MSNERFETGRSRGQYLPLGAPASQGWGLVSGGCHKLWRADDGPGRNGNWEGRNGNTRFISIIGVGMNEHGIFDLDFNVAVCRFLAQLGNLFRVGALVGLLQIRHRDATRPDLAVPRVVGFGSTTRQSSAR